MAKQTCIEMQSTCMTSWADSGDEETGSHRRANCLLGLRQSVFYTKENVRSVHNRSSLPYSFVGVYRLFRLACKVNKGNRLHCRTYKIYSHPNISPFSPPFQLPSAHSLTEPDYYNFFQLCEYLFEYISTQVPPIRSICTVGRGRFDYRRDYN